MYVLDKKELEHYVFISIRPGLKFEIWCCEEHDLSQVFHHNLKMQKPKDQWLTIQHSKHYLHDHQKS